MVPSILRWPQPGQLAWVCALSSPREDDCDASGRRKRGGAVTPLRVASLPPAGIDRHAGSSVARGRRVHEPGYAARSGYQARMACWRIPARRESSVTLLRLHPPPQCATVVDSLACPPWCLTPRLGLLEGAHEPPRVCYSASRRRRSEPVSWTWMDRKVTPSPAVVP